MKRKLFAVFIRHLLQLAVIVKKSSRRKAGGVIYCDPAMPAPPFSFFHYIVISPAAFEPEEYRQIILHERSHSRQWHSLDVLFAEIACIILSK